MRELTPAQLRLRDAYRAAIMMWDDCATALRQVFYCILGGCFLVTALYHFDECHGAWVVGFNVALAALFAARVYAVRQLDHVTREFYDWVQELNGLRRKR